MAREFTNYSKHSDTQSKQSEKALEMFSNVAKQEIKSGEDVKTVVDAGCGDGEVTEKLYHLLRSNLQRNNPKIIGVDKTKKRLKYAKRNHSNQNIRYLRGDLLNLSLDLQVDGIFSNAALHWVKNQNSLYKGFRNILRKNGILTVHQGGAGSYIELHDIAVKTANQMGLDINGRNMPPAYLRPNQAESILSNNGFEVLQMDAVEYPIEGVGIVKDFAEASLSSYFELVDESMIESYRNQFVKNGVDYVNSGGSVAARRLYFTAVRK